MAKEGQILIVDDNRPILDALSLLLKHHFNKVLTLASPGDLFAVLEQEAVDMVLLDMNYASGARDGSEGLEWLRKIRKYDGDIPVVLMTAYGGVELAVAGMKEGAADFILKPWNPDKLIANLKTLLKLRNSEKKLSQLRSVIHTESTGSAGKTPFFECPSPPMQRIYEAISKLAPTDANVLITGENGIGKEVIARRLHHLSARKFEVMVSVDLGALPESLFESELFGYKKGSFTDAKEDRKGRLELASGGTLFLDEIGNIPAALQVKLLSVLERREVLPIGASRPRPVDFRLVAATNAAIKEMIAKHEFREDLFYRINTITLHIPPLRERPEDIEGFCFFFLQEFSRKYRKPGLRFSDKALEKLKTHNWPGNVRELKHAVERATILCEGSVISPSDFFFRDSAVTAPESHVLNLKEVERAAVLRAVEVNQGNLSHAARDLGITRVTLYAKMKKYRIFG